MATITGDRARCVIQMPDGNSYVLGIREFRATMPPPEPVRLDPTDIYTGAPPRHYVGHGDSGTFTAKLCPPPPEPEPRTDAERLARAVLAGDQSAAGPLADLVQEQWQGGNRNGPALAVLREKFQACKKEATRLGTLRAAGLLPEGKDRRLLGWLDCLATIIAELEAEQ